MSDLQPLGPHGLRLLKQFEKGPLKVAGVPWPRTPNGAALRAYQCSADTWTIGWGCTEWFDGSRVGPGYVLADEASADKLLELNMLKFLRAVDRLVTVPINPLQRDALACLAMNIGEGAFADSTALRETNNGNFELAAEAFGLFSGATTYSPTSRQISNPEYAGAIGQKNGKWIWIGPTGQPCGYMTRLSGLRRRHMSETMLYKGLDWVEACAEGNVVITLRPPSERMWNGRKNRWEDRIKAQTSVADVEYIAERHPLDESEMVLFDMQPVAFEADDLDVGEVELESVEASTAPSEHVEAVTSGPVVGAQPPPAQGPANSPASPVKETSSAASVSAIPPAAEGKGEARARPVAPPPTPAKPLIINAKTVDVNAIPYGAVDPVNGAKNVTDTKRFAGMLVVAAGSIVQVLAAREVVTSTYGAIFYDFTREPLLVALFIGGVFWVVGHLTKKRGTKVITDGMQSASQLMK